MKKLLLGIAAAISAAGGAFAKGPIGTVIVPLELGVPPGGTAPTFVGADTFEITVNANGELVVMRAEAPDGEDLHCVGPKQ